MKNKKVIITLIILSVVACILLLGIMFFLLSDKGKFFLGKNYHVNNNELSSEVLENTYNSIELSLTAGEVMIMDSSSDQIKLVLFGDDLDDFKINKDNNKLSIHQTKKRCRGLCFHYKIDKIELYLPQTYAQKIKITNNYGDINVSDFPDADITISNNYGDVAVGRVNKLNVDSDYGDIDILEVNEGIIQNDAGDINIKKGHDLKIENNYGDVDIDHVLSSINAELNCGDIEITNLNLIKDSTIENALGSIEIGSTNQIFIDAQVDLGKIKIKNNYRESDITLKLENNCGDIEVNN